MWVIYYKFIFTTVNILWKEFNRKAFKDLANDRAFLLYQDCMCCQCLCHSLPLTVLLVFLYMLTSLKKE